jgi:opine dehydrogenase
MDKFEDLNRILLNGLSLVPFKQGRFDRAEEFISITLSVDNQILHPSRCYGLWVGSGTDGVWESEDKIPYFYRDFDERSARNIFKIDAEYTLIRDAIKKRYPTRSFKYMLNYLELENLNHSSGSTDILASLRDSEQLAAIRTPCVKQEDGRWALDTNCRFFTDDIPYGLLVAKWIAEQLGVATPFIDEIIQWAQKLRDEEFLAPNNKVNLDYCLKNKYRSGIPPAYGITSIDEIFE